MDTILIRIGNTWKLMSESFRIVGQSPGLMLFPLLSVAGVGLLSWAMMGPIFGGPAFHWPDFSLHAVKDGHHYLLVFIFYVGANFISSLFSLVIVSYSGHVLRGEPASISDSFAESLSKIFLIFQWSLVNSTVGVLLTFIESANKELGKTVSNILGFVWNVTSFMVLPALLTDGATVGESISDSAELVKKSWGEQVISLFSFKLLWVIFSIIPAVILGRATSGASNSQSGLVVIAGVLFVLGYLVTTTAESIFRSALYLYVTGSELTNYDQDLVAESVASI